MDDSRCTAKAAFVHLNGFSRRRISRKDVPVAVPCVSSHRAVRIVDESSSGRCYGADVCGSACEPIMAGVAKRKQPRRPNGWIFLCWASSFDWADAASALPS